MTEEKEWDACVDHIRNSKVKLWGLVHNAGWSTFGEVEWIPMKTYRRIADINVFGLMMGTQKMLPLILRTMLLTNEFDPITKFYKTICSESDIRAIARRFSNSYQLAVFDCSRLILNRQLHSGHYSKQEMALISARDLKGSFASELCCALQTKSSSRDQIIHEALQHD